LLRQRFFQLYMIITYICCKENGLCQRL
jgi:hypothetical protein